MIGCLVLPYLYTEAEAQRRPQLAGRAVAIHRRGRLTALSPAAEEAELRLDMPLGQAYAVCAGGEFLPYDEDLYRAAQGRVLELCATYVTAIEPFSLHEFFLDLAGAGEPCEIMAMIADSVQEQAGFTCQVGAGSSKLVARIAAQNGDSSLFPPGQCVQSVPERDERTVPIFAAVPVGQEARFLAPMPLAALWKLDEDDIEHLQALGITTIGLLQGLPLTRLAQHFGRAARWVSDLARGIDNSPVKPVYPPGDIEARLALPEGIGAAEAVDACLRKLSAAIAAQLHARRQACCRLSMQVEPESGRQVSRTLRLRSPAAKESDVLLACRRLLERMELAAPVTAIALQAADFRRCSNLQYDLFSGPDPHPQHRRRSEEALASAQAHFGHQAVIRGTQIEVPRRERMLAALQAD